MPLTAKGSEVMAKLKKEYGPESGERVFYAMKNKGTLTGVDSDERADAWKGTEEERSKRYGGGVKSYTTNSLRIHLRDRDFNDETLKRFEEELKKREGRGDAAEPGTPEDQTPIPADYGTKLDKAVADAEKLMTRVGCYMDRNDGQMCNIADSDTEAERSGIEIHGKREMVR